MLLSQMFFYAVYGLKLLKEGDKFVALENNNNNINGLKVINFQFYKVLLKVFFMISSTV